MCALDACEVLEMCIEKLKYNYKITRDNFKMTNHTNGGFTCSR